MSRRMVKPIERRKIIQNSIDYIENNLKAQITAQDLCCCAGFSLFYYYRLFQSAVGIPVMQYVLRRRLIHAIYEIRQGRKRIDVILEYGFNTYAGFYKAFQREFGCTPSAFLKKGRAKRPYKPNLFQEEHMYISHKKASEILKNWNLEKEPISDIYYQGSGQKNDNAVFVGENFVLKTSTNLGKVKNDIMLCKAIENAGLNVSSPVMTTDGREYVQDSELFFYVTRRISGAPVESCSFFEKDYKTKARFVGEMIGQLHLVLSKAETFVNDVNLYEDVKERAMPKAKETLTLPEQFCRDYLDTFGKMYDKLPKQIIHRDPNPGNIILSQDTWGIIDFELSEKNLRIYDPCYAATAILSENFDKSDPEKLYRWIEIYQNIIWGYDNVVKLTLEEQKAIPYVVIANQLICVAWFSGQNKHAEIFETNQHMTLWLVSVFDDLKLI